MTRPTGAPRLRTPTVWATYQVAGTHNWPGAAGARAYLADRHRHLFKIAVHARVHHDERDVEFHDLREAIQAEVDDMADRIGDGLHEFGGRSCETLARDLFHRLHDRFEGGIIAVEWSEDGEVGALLEAAE